MEKEEIEKEIVVVERIISKLKTKYKITPTQKFRGIMRTQNGQKADPTKELAESMVSDFEIELSDLKNLLQKKSS